ncbi:MAG: virulence RhuM family protein [Bacilli bacterium]|nr:virulence RhuM family protein [Bacilli bacterium]
MNNLEQNIIIYETGELKLDVHLANRTVWLNQQQLATIFQTTKQNISKHINKLFVSEELNKSQVVNFWFTTGNDGKEYEVAYYNLKVLIYLGWVIKSDIAKSFRNWAEKILEGYSIEGYSINEATCLECRDKINHLQNQIYEIREKQLHELTFCKGEQLEGYLSIKKFLETAKQSIYIIDDYFDHSFDDVLKEINVSTTIITDPNNPIESNEIYDVKKTKAFHDRFIFADGIGYHIGCSLKDIGNSLAIATRLESITLSDLLKLIK